MLPKRKGLGLLLLTLLLSKMEYTHGCSHKKDQIKKTFYKFLDWLQFWK